MTISFDSIPSNLRIPFVACEFNGSQASQGPALLAYRALLIGQKTSAGSATANTVHRVTSAADVITLAGRGSMLHRQAIAWFASNTFTELWIAVLADDGAGAAAAGTITVTGPATATGTIALYLGGVLVNVAVTSGDAATAIATAIAAAITANLDLPVTASPSSAVVTVTFRHKGTVGNSYDMRDSFRRGDALPAGVGLAYVALTGGTTDPSLTSLIAALGDVWYQIWAHPYTGSTPLTAIEAELLSRTGPMRSIDGLAITSAAGTFATLATLGGTRNSPYNCITAQPGKNPITPPMEFAAEYAAIVARAGAADPARPFQTLAFVHAQAPADADLFTNAERNLLLFDGIATSLTPGAGAVQIERLISTYQKNGAGAADTAYLDATTILTLMYLRFDWRTRIRLKYPRHKLAADGTRFGPGQAVMTPSLMKGEALGWFRAMEKLGLVQKFDDFKASLVVALDDADPNRLNALLPPTLIGQLVVSASQIQFRL